MENIKTLLAAVAQTTGFGDDEPVASTPSELGMESYGSPAVAQGDEITGVTQPVGGVVADLKTAVPVPVRVNGGVEKKKRGRPPKGQLPVKPPPVKRVKVEEEEEDVCFICFDGGSLVLCDRKGCPKAYHPACIKRDEAFFKSKAKWNCGWHICSVCMKTSHYLCYTCTYSLCKGCTKDTDYVCVRGNKGFCSTCMKTIMLIENKDQAISESIQVDFDDKLSWEYLFKMYWVLLKESLSLTLSELTQAKGPWKGLAAVTRKPRLNNVLPPAVGGEVSMSNRSLGHLELNKPHAECNLVSNDGLSASLSSNGDHVEKLNSVSGNHEPSNNKETVKPNIDKVTRETSIDVVAEKSGSKKSIHDSCIEKDLNVPIIIEDATKPCYQRNTIKIEADRPVVNRTEWASEDLLEFVKHVKNGDTSALSQFDVQTLLLDYIKRNNLLDPYQKSKIVCDQRLKNLFGRAHIDYTEMLKLLDFHFLLKEDSQKNSFIPAELVKSVADGNMYGSPKPINRRKRKMCKKSEDKVAKIDLNEYAAIDVHNVNLIYLRRNLMETLIENCENFSDKVIGSIVRIKISADDQKPEVHRLVQVIGTCKVSEPYKIGNRTIDVMLEVLNLDRKEVVSIVSISNDEFSEDECKWLRQSIKCGLVKQFTVDEVKMKALALQSVRVYDYRLEAEILPQNHLRDRAGKNEIKKEKYVDRLQLLKSAEEDRHKISQVPEIHVDPTMNPNYESEEDTRSGDRSKKDQYAPPSYSPFPQNDWDPLSSSNEKEKEEQSAEAQTKITEKTDASGSNDLDEHTDQIVVASSLVGGRNDQAIPRSGLETSEIATASIGDSRPADNIETEKLWHYRDPNSKIQGPFSMMQLRKCSTSGLFPPDMRIWTNHEQFDALLLTDALNGKFHGAPDLSHKAASSSPPENRPSGGIDVSVGTNRTGGDNKQTEVAGCNSSGVLSESRAEPLKTDELCSSGWPRCWDLLKDSNPSVEGVEVCDLLPSSKSEARDEALTDRGRESVEIKHSSQNGENNSIGPTQNSVASGDELQNQPKDEDRTGQSSSEGNLRSLNIDLSSNDLESVPVFTPLSKSLGSSKQAENIDVLDLLTPKTVNQQFLSADPEQGLGFLELLSPAPRSNNESEGVQEADTKLSGFINLPMSNSGSDWIGASNLGIGGVQLPDVADEWCGYSHTAARPSTAEWDSGLVSASCSRPPEVNCENTNTLAPDGHQLAHAASSHPTSNGTNWLAILNEPIEFVALGEDSVSDLLAEVDAMESRGVLPSPTSALKFAREFLEDCRDDCFSSIEDFSSAPEPRKSDAFSSTSDMNLATQSSAPCKQNGTSPVDAFDFFRRSSVNSSASSEGETSAAVHSGDAGSEFHPPAPHNTNQEMVGGTMAPVPGSDATDPGWGQMQGNINLVTVQGNVNLVLGGPTQGMANLGWGTNPGPGWANPNAIRSPRNGSLAWDGQRKYGGERFNCPREWGRPPWGRQPSYGGGGGYSRPLPKGQRVCKFYESGHCKKGAFCDYLHP